METINGVSLKHIIFCMRSAFRYFDNGELVPPMELLMTGGGGDTGMPLFYAGKVGDDLYIITRGATEGHDFLKVLDFAPLPVASGSGHGGVVKSARWIIDQCRSLIDGCKGKIVFTGHSLGGACSAVMTAILRLEENKTTVTCVTAGAFPVVTSDVKKLLEPFVTALVFNGDIVPLLTREGIVGIVRSIAAQAPPDQIAAMAPAMVGRVVEGLIMARGITDRSVFDSLSRMLPGVVQSLLLGGGDEVTHVCAGSVTKVVALPGGRFTTQPFVEGQPLQLATVAVGVLDHDQSRLTDALEVLSRPAPAPIEVEELD